MKIYKNMIIIHCMLIMNNYNDQQTIGYVFLSIIAGCVILCVLYGFVKLMCCVYKKHIQNNDMHEQLI